MRVASERVGWQEGSVVIFDDSFEHEVWCHQPEEHSRNLFIFDVWHPALTLEQRLAISSAVDPELMKKPQTLKVRRGLRHVEFHTADSAADFSASLPPVYFTATCAHTCPVHTCACLLVPRECELSDQSSYPR